MILQREGRGQRGGDRGGESARLEGSPQERRLAERLHVVAIGFRDVVQPSVLISSILISSVLLPSVLPLSGLLSRSLQPRIFGTGILLSGAWRPGA